MNHQDNLSRVNSHLDSILGQGAEILSGEWTAIWTTFWAKERRFSQVSEQPSGQHFGPRSGDSLRWVNSHLDSILGQGAEILSGEWTTTWTAFWAKERRFSQVSEHYRGSIRYEVWRITLCLSSIGPRKLRIFFGSDDSLIRCWFLGTGISYIVCTVLV
jgi:hypothetical protein